MYLDIGFPPYIQGDEKRIALRRVIEAFGDYLTRKSGRKTVYPDLVLKTTREYAAIAAKRTLGKNRRRGRNTRGAYVVALTQGTDGEHRRSETKMKIEVTSMISYTTERLLLRRGDNSRDNSPFLHMLKADGDFRTFSGAELTNRSLANFENYFEHPGSCYYAVFLKNDAPREMIGYAGFSLHHKRIEAEFYISKPHRGHGYCTEALKELLDEAFKGNLRWKNETEGETPLSAQTLYAITISSNAPAVRVLEKCGFIKNPDMGVCFQFLIDPETDDTYVNTVAEYVFPARVPCSMISRSSSAGRKMMMPLYDCGQCKQRSKAVYVHYGCTAEEFAMNRFREVKNFPPFAKPKGGFWASPAQAPFGWMDFCRREGYVPSSGLHKKFCFCLQPEAKIVRITAREDFELLPKMKTVRDSPVGKIPLIDFEECALRGIDAIEYCYSAIHFDEALGDEMDRKMPGWDCDSILIMNPQVIEPIF